MRARIVGLAVGLLTAALVVLSRAGRTSGGLDVHLNGRERQWWV